MGEVGARKGSMKPFTHPAKPQRAARGSARAAAAVCIFTIGNKASALIGKIIPRVGPWTLVAGAIPVMICTGILAARYCSNVYRMER
jgi:uncharacterized membrane protein